MNRLVRVVLTVSVMLNLRAAVGQESISDQHRDFFEKRIRPVLVQHCYECHSGESKTLQGGLLLDSRAGLLVGGDSGNAVVVGDSAASLLIESLTYGDDSFQMPPKGKLPDDVIADFRKWIDIGLPDPRSDVAMVVPKPVDVESGRDFWSFQPVRRVAPPKSETAWPRTAIDRFVERKILEAKQVPVVDADHRSLVRRIHIDLTGIPPTVEQIDAFVKSAEDIKIDEAIARVVNDLLNSPHFGERWARHWLDIARYAESSGGGRTLIFQNAWRYRDYVIRSFNEDKPFDTFIREQIAGDLLTATSQEERSEQLIATSFLALGPTNYELQDKDLLRMEVVDEQLDTIGRSMLGLTIGCARCHDHKFDPIPTSDYYAMAGIFRSTKTFTLGNVANFIERPLPSADFDDLQKTHRDNLAAVTTELVSAKAHLENIKDRVTKTFGKINFANWNSTSIDSDKAERIGDWTASTSVPGFVGENYLHDGNTGKGHKRVVYSLHLTGGTFELQASYTTGTNRATNSVYRIHHADGTTDVIINQQERPPVDGQFATLGAFTFSEGESGKIELLTDNTDGHVIADAVRCLPLSLKNVGESDPRDVLKQDYLSARSDIVRLNESIKRLKTNQPENPNKTMTVQEETSPTDWHVHIRGQIRNLGPVVPRGFVSAISFSQADISDRQSGRLEFANWIASGDNPLTARVMVNRIWQHLIGDGIVRTPDNFGSMGNRPTHPELLDYLASEFIEHDWSIKETIRQIMTSRVYRLSERAISDAAESDPTHQTFSHRTPRRLDAESLRDAILSVSGLLDTTMFGLTQRPGTKSEVDYKFRSQRRSIYVPWFRNTQLDMLQIFDAANPNVVTGRRTVTSMPTQALFMMNSGFVQEAAESFSRRVLRDDIGDTEYADKLRIDLAYKIAIGRTARRSERDVLLKFIASQREKQISADQYWPQICHLVLASVDFRTF